MNICICTTPIRPVPTTFPPFGSLAIIQSLRKIGEQARFFNIDYFRYSHEEVEAYFRDNRFDMVGISAVVSTAYAYTKYLVQTIRRVSPDTVVVVGGNLAASSEILLRKAGADVCVIGDGELIVLDLVRALREHGTDPEALVGVKGISFLDRSGQFRFTGYGQRPAADEIESPDYSILDADGSVSYFIPEASAFDGYGPGAQLVGTRSATVVMAKGCVARCTFCHRFERGYRARPIDVLKNHLRMLKETRDVGFIDISDENFGSDREHVHEVASALGELGLSWRAAGVRVRTVNLETLKHWKSCGCVGVEFGIESGSPTMLEVMEKKASVEDNIDALKAVHEAGLGTVIQLVIGMPGETDTTIRETTDFLKKVHPYMSNWKADHFPSDSISINYAQALPGTPLYEYAREFGLVGKSIDEEEAYLLRISDTDSYKEDHFVNYTGQPLLKVLMWRPLILSELDAFHLAKLHGSVQMSLWQLFRYFAGVVAYRLEQRQGRLAQALHPVFKALAGTESLLAGGQNSPNRYAESGYFNIQSGLKYAPLKFNALTRRLFYPIIAVAVAMRNGQTPGKKIGLIWEHVWWSLRQRIAPSPLQLPKTSLRKVVVTVTHRSESAVDSMAPLRAGR